MLHSTHESEEAPLPESAERAPGISFYGASERIASPMRPAS